MQVRTPSGNDRHALWLMPQGATAQRYGALIGELSRRHGRPVFEPHVTLLGRLQGSIEEIERNTARLATQLKPFTLRLERPDHGMDFHRCVFVRAAPSPAMNNAYRRACQLLPHRPGPPYIPHLSLLYGDVPFLQRRVTVDELKARCAGEFEVLNLYLYDCEGEPEQWRCVREYALLGQNSNASPSR
jgi:2'-5' RNA ligase